jgi:hypothetical protein
MKTKTLALLAIVITLLMCGGCRTAAEQGTVAVETNYGKVVQVHEAGDPFTTFSAGSTSFEVDMRDHLDGIDCEGITSDNAPFFMKIDVVYHPIHDKVSEYVTAFGFDDMERTKRRWNVLNQLVKNSARNATSGKYDAYALRANQSAVLQAIEQELKGKMASEMSIELVSVGMEIQPKFLDSRIDDAANQVVAAQKMKQAEQQYKEAAQIRLEKEQIQNQIFASSPQAFELRKLELQRDTAEAWSKHQGTLIFGGATQLQVPIGGK